MKRDFRVTREMRSSDVKKAACAYIDAGLSVLLTFGVTKAGKCTCGDDNCSKIGKHPLTPHFPAGVKSATRVKADIRKALRQHSSANLAVSLGGLTVVDVDGAAGQEAVDALKLPKTSRVETGRGQHLYFIGECPDGTFKGNQVDVLASGNRYAMVPPSRHASGVQYKWSSVNPGGKFPTIPERNWPVWRRLGACASHIANA